MIGRASPAGRVNWIKLLSEVSTLRALLALVNEFLREFPREHWALVPEDARPGEIAREDDIHYWHRRLVEAMGESSAPNLRLLDLTVFFVRAAARALELRRNGGGSHPSSSEGHVDGSAENLH
jgi:hypothetical protein